MAKKDFSMKFPAPNIKGIKSRNNTEESPTETDELETPQMSFDSAERESFASESEAAEPEKGSGDRIGQKLSKILENSKPEGVAPGENPFLRSKEHFDPASVIKTGYKMRVEYKQTLKLLAEIKKGYTIEALLDEALTLYLTSNVEAQKAINMMRMMRY